MPRWRSDRLAKDTTSTPLTASQRNWPHLHNRNRRRHTSCAVWRPGQVADLFLWSNNALLIIDVSRPWQSQRVASATQRAGVAISRCCSRRESEINLHPQTLAAGWTLPSAGVALLDLDVAIERSTIARCHRPFASSSDTLVNVTLWPKTDHQRCRPFTCARSGRLTCAPVKRRPVDDCNTTSLA